MRRPRPASLSAAHATYGRLLAGPPAALGSVARQQLAVLAARQGQIAQALSLLRQALLLDPHNAGARFDFEVLSEYVAQTAQLAQDSAAGSAQASRRQAFARKKGGRPTQAG